MNTPLALLVVGWRGSLVRKGLALGARHELEVDWGAFADAWRAAYRPAMDRVRRGELLCRRGGYGLPRDTGFDLAAHDFLDLAGQLGA